MAKKEPIKLGSREFASKQAAMEYIKTCLNWYHPKPDEEIDLPPDGFAVMMDVFLMHPDFDRKFPHGLDGVERIFIKKGVEYGGKWNQFWYQYDGVKRDISYKKCFSTSGSHRNCVVSAFREAIADQTIAFKQAKLNGANNGECAITHVMFPKEELAVDHLEPFSSLLARFMKWRKLDFKDIEIVHVEGYGVVGTRLADKDLERLWKKWHKRESTLQLVNAKLNVRLGCKDKDGVEAKTIISSFLKSIQ